MCENKYLKQAREELAYLSGDPDFQRLLESRAGFLMDMDMLKDQAQEEGLAKGLAEGLAKGLSKGLSKGEHKKQIEIAKKMKAKNISIDDIIELTGLSKEEIDKL